MHVLSGIVITGGTWSLTPVCCAVTVYRSVLVSAAVTDSGAQSIEQSPASPTPVHTALP